jgi:hypothetical protein
LSNSNISVKYLLVQYESSRKRVSFKHVKLIVRLLLYIIRLVIK